MHQNLKIEIERINNQYVTQIELSTFGRCGRARLVSDTFDEALKVLKAKHDELLASAMAFHSGVSPATNITHPSEALVAQKAPKPPTAKKAPAKGKGKLSGRAHKQAQKQLNAETRALAEAAAPSGREKPRQFASV